MTPELMACSVVVKRPATLLPMRSLGNPNLKFRMGLFETNLVKFVKKKLLKPYHAAGGHRAQHPVVEHEERAGVQTHEPLC